MLLISKRVQLKYVEIQHIHILNQKPNYLKRNRPENMAMSKSDYKLINKTKHLAAATDNCPVSGASAVEKRASFDSHYHSNYGGAGEGEGETSNNTGTI